MKTAVQLRPLATTHSARCDLLHGAPLEVLDGELGPVALFPAGALVAYRLRGRRRVHLYVFRTLDVVDPLATVVPGVRPQVQLLLEVRSAGRVRLARRLFTFLTAIGLAAGHLPDAFYLRVGSALAGRLPPRKILLSLLHRSATQETDHAPSVVSRLATATP